MTRSYPKSSQIANDDALETLGVSAETPLDTLFGKLAQEVEFPYRLHAAAPADEKLYISASTATTATGTQEVSSTSVASVTSFSSGYIDFQARANSANISISFPSSTVSFYRTCVLSALRDGTVKANFTAENADLGSLADPLTVVEISGTVIGWVHLQCTNSAGEFKTAGSATNIIENTVGGTPRIFHFVDKIKRNIVAAVNPSVTATDGFVGQLLQQSDSAQLWTKVDSGSSTNWRPLDWSQLVATFSGWATTSGITLALTGTNKETLQISGTRTFYVKGRPFRKTSADTATMSGSKGVRFFWYDSSGVLQVSTTVFDFKNSAPVAVAYWNGTSGHSLGWELHGLTDAADHYWKHATVGTRYVSGLQQTSSPLATGSPTGDTESYLWTTGGRILDEDIAADIVSATSPTNKWDQNLGSGLTSATAGVFPFLYVDSTNTAVFVPPNSDRFPFLYSGANGLPQYSNAGVLTATPSGNFAVYWVCATTTITTSDVNFGTIGTAVYIRPHVATYTSLALARAASFGELNWSDISVQENKVLYQVIYQCNNAYGNATHRCKIVEVSDLRAASPVPVGVAASASSHLLLSNLNGGQYGDGNHSNLTVTYVATSTSPTANNDSTAYKTGTLWVDSTAKRSFLCLNNTAAAADWREFAYAGGNDTALTLGTTGAHALTFKTNGAEAGNVASDGIWSIGPVAGGVTHVIRGNLTVNGNCTVLGTPTVISSETLLVADNQIVVNNGEVGDGVTAGKAGLLVDRGTATDYEFVFQESTSNFRVGLVGSTQAVATREDTPATAGLSFWNATSYRFDTDADLTWDTSNNRLSTTRLRLASGGYLEFGGLTSTINVDGFHMVFRVQGVTLLDLYQGTTNIVTIGDEAAGTTNIDNGLLVVKGQTGQLSTLQLSAAGSNNNYKLEVQESPNSALLVKSYDGSSTYEHIKIDNHTILNLGRAGNYIHVIRGTGALALPSSTTTNRDLLTPSAGNIRHNTTTSVIEFYSGSAWNNLATETYATNAALKMAIVLG